MAAAVWIPGVTLDAELGRGASSVVYRGVLDGAPCAVKIPSVGGRWTRWVYREAVALARVRHPGLPRVLEVGHANDLPYLAMELVDGEPLATRLARGSLPEAETVELGLQLAAALAAVHAVGLVHRDVKPRNIMLEAGGRARLVDFGFAMGLERIGREPSTAGTPLYAAPEQRRAPSRLDGRADLYALGLVLVECLTGKVPAERSAADVAKALEGRASAALTRLLVSLVAEAPEGRPRTASDVVDALLPLRDGSGAGPSSRAGRYQHIHRKTFALPGRMRELERILRETRDVEKRGGSLLCVVGDRGSGKTRLLAAAVAAARRPRLGFASQVACNKGDAPLALVRRLCDALIADMRAEMDGDDVALAKALRAAVGPELLPFVSLAAPALAALLGAADARHDATTDSFTEATAELLAALVRLRAPMLLAIDDVHWIDPLSRHVLIALADQIARLPLTLVLGARPDAHEITYDAVVAAAGARASRLDVPGLTPKAVREILTNHLGVEPPALLAERVDALAEATPLGVLEVLEAYQDAGALRPRGGGWVFDEERAAKIALPRGVTPLVRRRLEDVPPATRRVMEAAAVHDHTWDEAVLARVFGLTVEDVGYALADARRARLVDLSAAGRPRFVHHSVGEALVDGLDEDARRDLHQRLAEVLDELGRPDFESLCSTALHFASGRLANTPARAYWAQRAAADASLSRGANESALQFLLLAKVSAAASGVALDERFHAGLGEANLRLGDLDAARAAFEEALRVVTAARERARLLGRLAWVDQARSEPELAWISLGRAFELLGERMPVESVGSAFDTARALARLELPLPQGRTLPTADIELLCQLHYQNARLGSEYARPARLVQSTVRAIGVSRPLGESTALARAKATLGLVYAAIGRGDAGRRVADEAEAVAARLGDPSIVAFCAQARALATLFAGDWGGSLARIRACVDQHGLWLEHSEYCINALTADFIETVRGHARSSLACATLAYDRVRRRQRADGITPLVLLRMRASLAALGLDEAENTALSAQLFQLRPADFAKGWIRTLTWGPQARYLVERGEIGNELEMLMREFEGERIDPRRAHPMLAEFYMAVVDARVHQSLAVPAERRAAFAGPLRVAIDDLRKTSKHAPILAHVAAAEGHLAWLEGRHRDAEKRLARAERLAQDADAPAVLYAVARTRAHALAARGATSAARDQARIAEAIALEQGARPRARRIAEELGLTPLAATSEASQKRSSNESRGQLRSLVSLAHGPRRDASVPEQAALIAEEILRVVHAERCFLLYEPDARIGEILVGVSAGGAPFELSEEDRELLDSARRSEMPVESGAKTPVLRGRTIVTPLHLFDRIVGALGVELGDDDATDGTDRAVLSGLAGQVPVALELARLLEEREQLQASLLQAQRMEAVGQLAGGIAHDFNNMLAAILGSVEALGDLPSDDPLLAEELGVIRDAATRAADLTKRLLSFSRHRPLPLERVDTKQVLTGLVPMIKRIVGERVQVETLLGDELPAVLSDPPALEQALVNLATNARDAMKKRGKLTLRTREVELGPEAVRRGAPAAGIYVAIDVTDSGEGMSREVLQRIFDPFFSTKPTGAGTGLGLTMVYTFIKRSGGHIEVTSTPGSGTTFSLYFPVDQAVQTQPASTIVERTPAPRVARQAAGEFILVVDDDPLVRSSLQRMLRRQGYEVIVASGSEEATVIVRERAQQIALVILDVLMPGATGPELDRRWKAELDKPPKVLFVSGFSPETLPTADAGQVQGAMFLQKPFSNADLVSRVERILESAPRVATS